MLFEAVKLPTRKAIPESRGRKAAAAGGERKPVCDATTCTAVTKIKLSSKDAASMVKINLVRVVPTAFAHAIVRTPAYAPLNARIATCRERRSEVGNAGY